MTRIFGRPIVLGEVQDDGTVFVPLETRIRISLSRGFQNLKRSISGTSEKTNTLFQSFIEWLSALFEPLMEWADARAFQWRKERDPIIGHEGLGRPIRQLKVSCGRPPEVVVEPPVEAMLKEPASPPLSPRDDATISDGSTISRSPSPLPSEPEEPAPEEEPIDPCLEISQLGAHDEPSLVQAELTLFFQSLGLSVDDRGAVAESFRQILTPKFGCYWRRCINPISGHIDPIKFERTATSLFDMRRVLADNPTIRSITRENKRQLDRLALGTDRRAFTREVRLVCDAFERIYLPQ